MGVVELASTTVLVQFAYGCLVIALCLLPFVIWQEIVYRRRYKHYRQRNAKERRYP